MGLGQGTLAQRNSPTARRRFDSGRDHKRQRPFIMNRNPRVLHAQLAQHFAGLLENRRSVIWCNPRFEGNLDPSAIPRLERNVHIRANVFAPVARFARARRTIFSSAHSL